MSFSLFFKRLFSILLLILIVGLSTIGCQQRDEIDNGYLIKEKAIAVLTGDQVVPHLAPARNECTWVSFYSRSEGTFQMRMQLLDGKGGPLLANDGLLVSNKPTDTYVMNYTLESDIDGQAMLAFSDRRCGNFDVQGYKVSPNGEFLWGTDGINLSANKLDNWTPHAIVTAENDLVVAWTCGDEKRIESIVLQRVSAAGVPQWGTGKIISGATGNICEWPVLLRGDGGSFLLIWAEAADGMDEKNRVLYAQKFSGDGTPQWPAKVKINNDFTIVYYRSPLAVADSSGGVYIAWQAVANCGLKSFVQHLSSQGVPLFPDSGISLSDSEKTDQIIADIAYSPDSDNLGVVYADKANGDHRTAVILQSFSSNGEPRWGGNGLVVTEGFGAAYDFSPFAVRAKGTEFAVFWEDYPFSLNMHGRLLGCVVPLTDSPVLSPIILADYDSVKMKITVSGLINGGFWIVWDDLRQDGGDIYGTFWKNGQ